MSKVKKKKTDKKPSNEKVIRIAIDSLIAAVCFAVSTGLCYLLDYFSVDALNFIIIYILGILCTAVFTKGCAYSLVLSVISTLGYNFFFTSPRFSFRFNDTMYIVTFVLMFLVGVVTSTITFMLKKRMMEISALNVEKAKLKSEVEKEQLKATILRSISEDLEAPVKTMKEDTEKLLENEDITDEEKKNIIKEISLKAGWTERIVGNLLSLSRIDNESFTVDKTPQSVRAVVHETVRNCREAIGDRMVFYDMPPDYLFVPMDSTLIAETIGNILINAGTYTPKNGNIWIKVFEKDKNAVFCIANDGKPISEKDLPHIFEMYYTTNEVGKEKGMGLGLAICKLIVTAHGGRITARNSKEGRVEFEFTLPLEE